ncbi:hypothetical protein Trydic_g5929 [Trypoxylus dichotomus]
MINAVDIINPDVKNVANNSVGDLNHEYKLGLAELLREFERYMSLSLATLRQTNTVPMEIKFVRNSSGMSSLSYARIRKGSSGYDYK